MAAAMNYNRSPIQHTSKVAHAGHAPPKFRSPANASTTPSISASIRRPLPPAPRNKDSSSGLSDSQAKEVPRAYLRSFEHHIPLKHDVKYIYAPNPTNIVYFYEYHGHGVPSPTLGALGDVFLTINTYQIFVKCLLGWVQWTTPGWFEHPFLTDTVLWFSLESVVWIHPTMTDEYSQASNMFIALQDMLDHQEKSRCSNQASDKQIEANGKDNSDAVTDGNDSRKRARVDEETSSPAHNSEPPSSPLSIQESVQMVSASFAYLTR
jgi:hypothetical protein